MELKVEVKRELSPEFIDDIFVTAFEGGINYWCIMADPTKVDGKTVSAKLTYLEDEGDDESTTEVEVTTEGMVDAIKQIIEGTYTCRPDIRSAILHGVLELDTGNMDADCADVIVQYAGLKDIVFG